jgi:16S rRNA processing protein RimM
VGFVSRPHGTRGEVRVVLHNPTSTALSRAETVHVDGQRHRVIAARQVEGAWLLAVDGVSDRNTAEGLRGARIAVDREALDLGVGEVLLADLVGCRVHLRDGTPWGQVAAIAAGPQDLLVIHGDGVERLLPLVDELVISIDVASRLIVVDPPEDLPEVPL